MPNGTVIAPGIPIVSFVNRRFEPIRGFHTFMRMIPMLLGLVPNVHILLVGSDEPENTYGLPPSGARCWREAMLTELQGQLDRERVHFLAKMPHDHLQALFSNVTAHVYLTYPFVLSWSLLDAMACEALVIASNTAPVLDVVEDGRNGLLVDFFDSSAMAAKLASVCRDPARYQPLREAARETILHRYDRDAICMPQWLRLVEDVAAGRAD